jgi:hypothetical protein
LLTSNLYSRTIFGIFALLVLTAHVPIKKLEPSSCEILLYEHMQYIHGLNSSDGDFMPTGQFEIWLANAGLQWEGLNTDFRAIKLYEFIQSIGQRVETAEDLPKLQDAILVENIKNHGGTIFPSESGRMALKRISAANLARELARMPLKGNEFKAEVEDYDIVAIHNSKLPFDERGGAVLSSKLINDLGLPGGLNTLAFNSEFMRTDDNVFFTVKLLYRDQLPQQDSTQNQYGKNRLILDHNYAMENAMVSFYVMYPKDLQGFAKMMGIGDSPSMEAKNNLYLFDYTLEDFERLIRHGVCYQLQDLKNRNLYYLPLLAEKRAGAFATTVMSKLTGRDYDQFELKIPRAVPRRYLRPSDP